MLGRLQRRALLLTNPPARNRSRATAALSAEAAAMSSADLQAISEQLSVGRDLAKHGEYASALVYYDGVLNCLNRCALAAWQTHAAPHFTSLLSPLIIHKGRC